MSNRKIRLEQIPKPDPKNYAILEAGEDILKEKKPYITGSGELDYVCRNCEFILVKGIEEGQVRSMVFKCPNCDAYNLC